MMKVADAINVYHVAAIVVEENGLEKLHTVIFVRVDHLTIIQKEIGAFGKNAPTRYFSIYNMQSFSKTYGKVRKVDVPILGQG